MSFSIRRATAEDKPEWLRMRQGLWPDAPIEYLNFDMDDRLADPDYAVFVASGEDGQLVAFIEAGLRDYGEGCETVPLATSKPGTWTNTFAVRNLGEGWCMRLNNGHAKRVAVKWRRIPGWRMRPASPRIGDWVYEEAERLVHFVKRLCIMQ